MFSVVRFSIANGRSICDSEDPLFRFARLFMRLVSSHSRITQVIAMLRITEIRQSELTVGVEVDPYIPIAARTFTAPIGAVYYRVGNFDTSLVEMPIDPNSGIVRGIKLVSFDRIGSGVRDEQLPAEQGLPVVAPESVPTKRLDEAREFAVSLIGSRFFVDWSNGQQIDSKATLGRMTFFLGGGTLLGAAIENITETEARQLEVHLQSARKQ
jgi:hypothetical protein